MSQDNPPTTTPERGWVIAHRIGHVPQVTKSGAEGDGTLLGLVRVCAEHHPLEVCLSVVKIISPNEIQVEDAREMLAIHDSLATLTDADWAEIDADREVAENGR